ncbi:COG1361 S-layer family protein [Halorientalis salina]|uniref:COG1361 S-layer family protein n=1 Tax=Halorientalis salina TaxID=2932266 RepID=UPI0010AB7AA5|nr:COG1361 S-layer family protein [Halorientalis salina]
MRGTQIAVLLVVASLLVPTPVLASVNGSPDIDASVPNDRLTPGEDTELTVKLTNTGNLESGSSTNPSLNSEVTTARGVEVELESDGAPISVRSGSQTTGQLPQGQSAPFGFDISVDEDAEPGTYEMEAVVEYKYTSSISETEGTRNEKTETERYDVEVVVDDRANFEVVDTETDVRVGASGTAEVTMENTGTEAASDTTVELASPNGDLTFGNGATTSTRYVGNWEPGETRTVEYQVLASSSAKEQSYAFTATANFEDSDGVGYESNPLTLGVTPLTEQRFSVLETESDVAVGDTGTVAVTMRNDGAIDVNDATVNLESRSSDIVFGESSSASRFVGDWAAGETRTVEFDATATEGADTRSYALESSVAFDDENDDSGTSRPVSLGVTPLPEMEFSLSNVSSDLRVGEERTLRGTITNDGETTARDVVVRFATENENVNPTEREYSVGTLQPGESADFDFAVEISDGAASGPRQFSFTTEYRNTEDETRQGDSLVTRQQVGDKSSTFDVDVRKGNLTNGGSTDLEVAVTNTANETLTDISAKLFADSPISASDSDAFIAELEPGETKNISFTVSASGASPKAYPVSMDFQYDDEDGDTLVSDSYRVPVTVTEKEGSGGGFPLILVGLGVAAVVGIGGYMRFR